MAVRQTGATGSALSALFSEDTSTTATALRQNIQNTAVTAFMSRYHVQYENALDYAIQHARNNASQQLSSTKTVLQGNIDTVSDKVTQLDTNVTAFAAFLLNKVRKIDDYLQQVSKLTDLENTDGSFTTYTAQLGGYGNANYDVSFSPFGSGTITF